jgi:ABC-type multidrug transport system fused ATPase/permease subunit
VEAKVMKTCEVCGRRIRTGYKYCWEHRHTSEGEKLRGDVLFNKAQKFYFQWVSMIFMMIGFGLLFLISYLVVVLGGFMLLVNGAMVIAFIIMIIIFLPFVLKNRIIRSEKCEEYVKNHLRKHQDERDRINRIKDEAFR